MDAARLQARAVVKVAAISLLAIPTAATIGVLIDEGLRWRRETGDDAQAPGPGAAQPEPAAD